MSALSRLLPAAVAMLLAVLAAGAAQAAAQTYTVSAALDTEPAAGNRTCAAPCSLRQAIQDADETPESESIVEIPPGEYALRFGRLAVAPGAGRVVNIRGLGARANEVVIRGESGANADGVISIATPGAVPEVSLAMIEITGGHTQSAGGGIEIHNANVVLADVAIRGNVAAQEGGGIEMAEGKLSVADTVISGNAAEGTPGTGGGIDVKGGSVVATNDTIADNTASGVGGGIYNAGELAVNAATIAGNEAAAGGGLGGSKPAEFVNTILALNGHQDCSIAITGPLGHNLADDGSCKLTEAGDKPEVNAGLALLVGAPKPTPLLADNGGFTETIALQSNSAALAAGSESACLATDQRGVGRPPKLCDIGALQLSKAPEPPGSSPNNAGSPNTQRPPSGGPPPLPTPVFARTGNVAPVSGAVLVELPGTRTFVALTSLRSVPFGTVIDATHGRVVVTTAGPHGGTQTGEFFGGEFVLTQKRNGEVQAALTGGDFAGCPTARERGHRASVASAGRHPVRKLWANAHGSFSTKGSYAAGAVEGTEWLTEDFCNGTLIRVTRDKVLVTDLVNRRHFLVKAGHSRFAKAPPR